jgi:hypothetical protein
LTSYTEPSTEIPRIPASGRRFRDEFLTERRPVVIQGLFEGTDLGAIRTMDAVRERFGRAELSLRNNYMSSVIAQLDAFTTGRISARSMYRSLVSERKTTVADYVDAMKVEAPRNPYMAYANEQPPPPEMLRTFGKPEFFDEISVSELVAGVLDIDIDVKLPASAARCFVFMANAGNAADTHTDWDGRQVLNYEVAGRKRFVLFPPEAALKLSTVQIFPMPRLRTLSDEDRLALLRYAGGCECILEPGEAVYMPPFWFHHIDYLTDALGVGIRFAGPPAAFTKLFYETHRDFYMQNAWARIIQDPTTPEHVDALARIQSALVDHHPSRLAKYRAVQQVARDLCVEWKIFPAAGRGGTWVSQTELLERPLSTTYLQPPEAWTPGRRRWWRVREASRLAAVTLAMRFVDIIERRA